MKYIILLGLILMGIKGFSAIEYSLSFASGSQEILWLKTKSIKNKTVYIMGYKSPHGRQLERVVPMDEFSQAVSEIRVHAKIMQKNMNNFTSPFCSELVVINNNNIIETICLNFINLKEKANLTEWMLRKSNIIVSR